MKKLFIILSIMLVAIITIGCNKDEDTVRRVKQQRLEQMEYVEHLYQFNRAFCPEKKYWEVENYLDSIALIDKNKILEAQEK